MAPSEITTQPPGNEGPGGHIGPYRILRQIGEGGFGQVFEAEQDHPVKRRVAIKVIRLGMDTRDVIARFEAERQALALMDHPHIARVLEAGSTGTGRPYFVKELVRGEPITTYCDGKRLSVDERLKLFEQVCQAVQHAHSKGVIHRDLKPSNVLVSTHDDAPFARVIDFGIAKAIAGRLTDRTYYTAEQQMIGTPLYMSPEQAEGSADIDTRSDVYSLGVMLYELLTGSTPVDALPARPPGLAEMQRLICEVDPPLPSAHLAKSQDTLRTLAQRYRSEPRTLTRQIRGELDWIVMKALEKERTRRYETANGLAMDIRRYLAGEPVLAAPPSVRYRIGKFVRRNRVAVAAAVAFVLVLMGAVVFSTLQAERARAAEIRADLERDAARGAAAETADVLSFLREKVLGAAAPEGQGAGLGREVSLRAAVDAAEKSITAEFGARPAVESALRETLGNTYHDLGDYAAAIRQFEQALRLRTAVDGATSETTLDVLDRLTWAMAQSGEYEPAIAMLEVAVAAEADGTRERRADLRIQASLATLLGEVGRLPEAIARLDALLPRQRALLGSEHDDVLTTLNNLAGFLARSGRVSEAFPYFEEGLDTVRRIRGPKHYDTILGEGNLGTLYRLAARPADAELLLRSAHERAHQVFGPEHGLTENMAYNLAVTLRILGRDSELPELLEPVVASRHRRGLAPWQAQMQLATAWVNLGESDRARTLLEELEPQLGERASKDPSAAQNLVRVARLRFRLSDFASAARVAAEAGALARAADPPDATLVAHSDAVRAIAELKQAGPAAPSATDSMSRLSAALTVLSELAPSDSDTLWVEAQTVLWNPDCPTVQARYSVVHQRLEAAPITQDAGRRTLQSLALQAAEVLRSCGEPDLAEEWRSHGTSIDPTSP
jgi:tetratricopeptide (TPR) repeat protein